MLLACACSSNSNTVGVTDGGPSDGASPDAGPPAQAGVSVAITPGNNSDTQCPIGAGDTWSIGGEPTLEPVPNGQSSNGATVTVSCSVAPQATGFAVSGDVSLAGQGSFTVSGTFDGTTQAQQDITASFGAANGDGSWMQSTCTVTFPNPGMGVAAGRVWAQVDCPTMVDGVTHTQCDGSAQFRLENCATAP